MIENCCKNCAHYYILDYLDNQKYCEFKDCEIKHECSTCFQPKEELVREDEREKVLNEKVNLLCNDLEITFENKEYTIQEILDIINNRDLDAWCWREND